MKNDGKLDQDISGRNGEKWLDSEDTSKIERQRYDQMQRKNQSDS